VRRFLIAVTALVCPLVLIKEVSASYRWIPNADLFYVTLAFVVFATVLVYAYLIKMPPAQFTPFYLLLSMVKLIGFLAYLVIVVIKLKSSSPYADVVVFLVCYLLFTALEIGFLYRYINPPKR
jgi:hypothetical protein